MGGQAGAETQQLDGGAGGGGDAVGGGSGDAGGGGGGDRGGVGVIKRWPRRSYPPWSYVPRARQAALV